MLRKPLDKEQKFNHSIRVQNITDGQTKLTVGLSVVRIMKRDADPLTGKPIIVELHRGVVIQDLGTFVRVYSDAKPEDGGDVAMDTAGIYPVKGRNCWAEWRGDLSNPVKIPATIP